MLPNKSYLIRAFYDWIVDSECTPYIAVDTTVDHVQVPEQYIQDNQIILNISPSAIREFTIKSQYLRFVAKFDGEVMDVYSPIKAIAAIYAKENGRGMMFDLTDGEDADHPMLEPEPYSHFIEKDGGGDDDGGGSTSASHLKVIK